jgi:hypothetical protein
LDNSASSRDQQPHSFIRESPSGSERFERLEPPDLSPGVNVLNGAMADARALFDLGRRRESFHETAEIGQILNVQDHIGGSARLVFAYYFIG